MSWRSNPAACGFSRPCAGRERCPYAVLGQATQVRQLHLTDEQLGQDPVDMPLEVLLGKAPRMFREINRQSFDGDGFFSFGLRYMRGSETGSAFSLRRQ